MSLTCSGGSPLLPKSTHPQLNLFQRNNVNIIQIMPHAVGIMQIHLTTSGQQIHMMLKVSGLICFVISRYEMQ